MKCSGGLSTSVKTEMRFNNPGKKAYNRGTMENILILLLVLVVWFVVLPRIPGLSRFT